MGSRKPRGEMEPPPELPGFEEADRAGFRGGIPGAQRSVPASPRTAHQLRAGLLVWLMAQCLCDPGQVS